MALTLAGVTFAEKEKPYDGAVSYQGESLWAEARPLGYKGRIMRKVGADAKEHNFRCLLLTATVTAIQAVIDADGESSVSFTWSDGDIGITAQSVTIKRFRAEKNRKTTGTSRWDCELVLVVV